jgi:hypothetical protein
VFIRFVRSDAKQEAPRGWQSLLEAHGEDRASADVVTSDGVFSAGYRMVRGTEPKLSVITPDAAIRTYKEHMMEKRLDEAGSLESINRAATASANCGMISSRKETHGAAFRAGGTPSYSQDVTGFKSWPAPDTGEMGRPTE